MIAARFASLRTPADLKLDLPIDATIRVPLNKRRIALQALVGLIVTLATTATLILMALDVLQRSNDWQLTGTALALAGAISSMLRGMRRLQDPEPGLIVGPRGVRIRSDEKAQTSETIPWNAIGSLETRGHQGRMYVALLLREPQRYAQPSSLLGYLFGWLDRRAREGVLVISPQWLRIALPDLETMLRRYLQHYGKSGKTP